MEIEAYWIQTRHDLIRHFQGLKNRPGADVPHLNRKIGRERAFLTMGLSGTRAAAAKAAATRTNVTR